MRSKIAPYRHFSIRLNQHMASLQEQLLKAGLVNQKKAKQAEREKKKVAKQVRQGEEVVDETKLATAAARAAKIEKDKTLNGEQKAKAEQKAITAQIAQLIQSHALDLRGCDVDYNFTDGKKIKKVLVSDLIQYQLSRGMLAIAKRGNDYSVIPAVIAEKIQERNALYIVSLVDVSALDAVEEDDPYANYQIPDDLMW